MKEERVKRKDKGLEITDEDIKRLQELAVTQEGIGFHGKRNKRRRRGKKSTQQKESPQ